LWEHGWIDNNTDGKEAEKRKTISEKNEYNII
jgi:hypothetical protein